MIASLGPLPAGDKSVAKYRQISDYLRGLIQAGELRPGTRLPSMNALAKAWETNSFTVCAAFTPLANDGLVRRTPRGTFVQGRNSRITSVAVYFGTNPWDDPEGSYFQQAYRELRRELERRKIQCHLFMDSRAPAQQVQPLSDLAHALELREIQGVIGLMLNDADVAWLTKLPGPVSYMFSKGKTAALGSTEAMALDRLARDGCKTVGLIHPTSDDLYSRFETLANERGMKTRRSWVRTLSGARLRGGERFGYQQFKQLWALPERPKGLIIHPDWVCRGAITAILELGVRVPQNLRPVLFRNAGLDYVCPWRVPMVVSDIRKRAAVLVQDLLTQDVSRPERGPIRASPDRIVG